MIQPVIIGCIVLTLLPPRWDPAIRLKEWQILRCRHPESRKGSR